MSEEQPPAEGGGAKKGVGIHLPMWGWALILGGVGGLVYFVRKKQAAASAASSTTDTSGTGTDTSTPTEDIIPVDEGGDDSADAQLLQAINKLQGSLSQPSPPTGVTGQPKPGPTPVPVKGKPPVTKKPPAKAPAPKSQWIKVKPGMSFSTVAAEYGHTWQQLWAYQLEPGVRPADTQKTLRDRGPSHALFDLSEIAVPESWQKKKK